MGVGGGSFPNSYGYVPFDHSKVEVFGLLDLRWGTVHLFALIFALGNPKKEA